MPRLAWAAPTGLAAPWAAADTTFVTPQRQRSTVPRAVRFGEFVSMTSVRHYGRQVHVARVQNIAAFTLLLRHFLERHRLRHNLRPQTATLVETFLLP